MQASADRLFQWFASFQSDRQSDIHLPEMPGKKVFADGFPIKQLHYHIGHKYHIPRLCHVGYRQLHNRF